MVVTQALRDEPNIILAGEMRYQTILKNGFKNNTNLMMSAHDNIKFKKALAFLAVQNKARYEVSKLFLAGDECSEANVRDTSVGRRVITI